MKQVNEHKIVTTLQSIDKSLSRIAVSGEALVSLFFSMTQLYMARQSPDSAPAEVKSAQHQIDDWLQQQRERLRNG